MSKDAIYRKVAIERLSSPDQLDEVMTFTPARAWLAVAAGALLIATCFVWSVAGTIPTRVRGTGVLIKTGGVYDVVAPSSGHISDVSVRAGDRVREGQVLARVDQPVLVDQLRTARARLAEAEHRNWEARAFARADADLAREHAAREAEVLARSLAAARQELEWLEAKIQGQRALLEDGLIRKEDLLATEQSRNGVRIRAEQLESEFKQLELRTLARKNGRREELARTMEDVTEARRVVAGLEDRLRSSTQVRSPHTGRILEVMTEVGALAQQGLSLMRMDRAGEDVQDLEAVIYIPGLSGKRVRRGMEVQLSPAGVRREEHGYMVGAVATVSDYPATQEAMNRILKNQDLVQMLAGEGAPYEAFVSLTLDPESADGYAWSSRSPGFPILSGTLCSATITTHRRRPIELVAPFLKNMSGL